MEEQARTMRELLRIEDLVLSFTTEEGEVEALDGVNLSIRERSFHGLIGETGCGKSVTGRSIIRLLDNNAVIKAGRILYKGEDLLQLSDRQMEKRIRGNEVAMIFQDPSSSLDPVFSVRSQMAEVVRMYHQARREEYDEIIAAALRKVRLPAVETLMNEYPHQLSGGMKQRVMIAMMLACKPHLLIADEPTTALDVSIQAQFIKTLKELKESLHMTVLYITHDLAVISELCDHVSVMYAGRIVETTPMRELFKNPVHPYAYKLLNSVLGVQTNLKDLVEIPGTVPRLINPPAGCRFHPRCDEATEICGRERPPFVDIGDGHYVACHTR